MTFDAKDLIKKIEEQKARSCWARAVRCDAADLVERAIEGQPGRVELCRDAKSLEIVLLNGAEDWKSYSWGGCALIYDEDIASWYCTPSEYERTQQGRRKPNAREEWLDVQARALRQAAALAGRCLEEIIKEG